MKKATRVRYVALSAVLKTPGGRDRTRQLDVCIRLRTAKRSVAACTRETYADDDATSVRFVQGCSKCG